MNHIPYHSQIVEDLEEYKLSYWIDKLAIDTGISKEVADVLLESVKEDKSFYDLCEVKLYWSVTKTTKFIKKYFPDKKSGSMLRNYVCSKYSNKYCVICCKVRPTKDFTTNNSRPDGLQQRCIYCDSSYRKENAQLYKYHSAIRRNLNNQLLSKKYKQQILDFYKACPKGYQVDHIIPINGNNVCGLHVPWNLQYLTATANNKKKNKFVDVPL